MFSRPSWVSSCVALLELRSRSHSEWHTSSDIKKGTKKTPETHYTFTEIHTHMYGRVRYCVRLEAQVSEAINLCLVLLIFITRTGTTGKWLMFYGNFLRS